MVQLFKKIKHELSYGFGASYAPYPTGITIELNYNCMFRCKICQMWKDDFKNTRLVGDKILGKDELLRIIDELSGLKVNYIYFCGGEPFLRNDFFDIVGYCKSKRIYCSTISNGYLIDEGLSEKIVASKLDLLGISIDSASSSLHDEIRGAKNAFYRATEGIRLIKKKQTELNTEIPEVFINCTVSSRNFMVLHEIVDLAKLLNVRRINFNYLSVLDSKTVELTNRVMGEKVVGYHTFSNIDTEYLLQKEQVDQLDFVIENIKKKCGSEIKCDLDPALANKNKELLLEGKFAVSRCNIPWKSAMITPLGDVVPCAMFTDYKMGNIREETFSEIWNNERARHIRRLLSKYLPPICQKCCMVHTDTPSLVKKIYYKFRNM